jgi:hypothetical protein
MVEVKTHPDHPASMEQRVRNRLKNSGDTDHADHVVQTGNSSNRVFTNIHNSRAQQYGSGNPGEGDINGGKRGVV